MRARVKIVLMEIPLKSTQLFYFRFVILFRKKLNAHVNQQLNKKSLWTLKKLNQYQNLPENIWKTYTLQYSLDSQAPIL